MKEKIPFIEAKDTVIDNLQVIQADLIACVDQGMQDSNAHYYNELIDLLNEAGSTSSWDDLEEVIAKAKTLEIDIAAWLSFHGRNSVSLTWPYIHK